MRRSALGKVHPRLTQAERTIHRQTHLGGILILLAVVLPPAHRTELQSLRRRQRPVAATWTAILIAHTKMDGFRYPGITPAKPGQLHRPVDTPVFFTGTLCKNFGCQSEFTQSVCF